MGGKTLYCCINVSGTESRSDTTRSQNIISIKEEESEEQKTVGIHSSRAVIDIGVSISLVHEIFYATSCTLSTAIIISYDPPVLT